MASKIEVKSAPSTRMGALQEKLLPGVEAAHKQYPVYDRQRAIENLNYYKSWMLAQESWIPERMMSDVLKVFSIIEDDIAISVGAHGEVEDLVCGPALPMCYWANAFTWISFFIIGYFSLHCEVDEYGMALFPSGWTAAGIFGVFAVCTFLSLAYEYIGALYVLPSQAIACGEKLRPEVKDKAKSEVADDAFCAETRKKVAEYFANMPFNHWLVSMLVISFLYHLDICTSAIFIARVYVTCNKCDELNKLWKKSITKSVFLGNIPLFHLSFEHLVLCGSAVMLVQLIYALAFSYPRSPNLARGRWNESDYNWCKYRLADVDDDEILDHPEALKGKRIGEVGDWTHRPPGHRDTTGKRLLEDVLLVDPVEHEEQPNQKLQRLSNHVKGRIQLAGHKEETYHHRLAFHRRARVAIYHSFIKSDMGYGRAVQALVESGRMNLMQAQDDCYLRQAEHNWSPWTVVNEIRRTNFRFFFFALQAAFIPNFQITYFGISSSHAAQFGDEDFTLNVSNAFTATSTIICTIVGMKYLHYEYKSVTDHENFATWAISRNQDEAMKTKNWKKRWDTTRLKKRALFSRCCNGFLFFFFFMFYIYLCVKVTMVMFVCPSDHRLYDVKMPWADGGMTSGCQMVEKPLMCKCSEHGNCKPLCQTHPNVSFAELSC